MIDLIEFIKRWWRELFIGLELILYGFYMRYLLKDDIEEELRNFRNKDKDKEVEFDEKEYLKKLRNRNKL